MWMRLCPISLRIEISRAVLEPVWLAKTILNLEFRRKSLMGKMQCIVGQIASAAAETQKPYIPGQQSNLA